MQILLEYGRNKTAAPIDLDKLIVCKVENACIQQKCRIMFDQDHRDNKHNKPVNLFIFQIILKYHF